MDGWLEPLVARIQEDRTRVVIPSLHPINTRTLSLNGHHGYPPWKGSFNWRLTFTLLPARPETDILGEHKEIGPVRSPVMPGGRLGPVVHTHTHTQRESTYAGISR